jgi:copper chaperone CopZ
MANHSLSFKGVENADQINRITTALMMLDGVDSVEVGRHGAEVEGRARREALIEAVKSLGLPIDVK